MKVTAEQFNEEVTIERPQFTVDAEGDRTVMWEVVGTYFAKIDARGTRRRVTGNQEEFFTAYRLTLRAPAAITDDMRVIWNGLTLAIETIAPERTSITLLCRKEAQ